MNDKSTALFVLALGGCASSSGVLKTGPETYTISTSASPGKGGMPAAKRMAYEEASAKCTARGLELFVLSEKPRPTTWTDGMAGIELSFRCSRPDDPELKRQR